MKDENHPRILQIAWLILDEYGYVRKRKYYTIKIGDFNIDQEAFKLHGIDNDLANIIGDDIKSVLKQFISDLKTCRYIVAHNLDFDLQMINSELIRNNFDINISQLVKLHCTMKNNGDNGTKYLKLQELYSKYYDESYQPTHKALFDVYVLKKCFYVQNKDDYSIQPLYLDEPIKSIDGGDTVYNDEHIAQLYIELFDTRKDGLKTSIFYFLDRIRETTYAGYDVIISKPFLTEYKATKLNKSQCENIINKLQSLIAKNLLDKELSHCLFLLSIAMTIKLQILLEIDEELPPWEQHDYDSYQMIHEKRENIERIHNRCLEANPNYSFFFAISTDDRIEIAPLYRWDYNTP